MNQQQYQQQRNYLTDVWHDTVSYFKKHPEQIPCSIKYDITKLPEPKPLDVSQINKPTIEILNRDTLNMAMDYIQQDKLNPLVINMASYFCPGGGVRSGKTAQEEEIFRRSNAHLTHPRSWYPLNMNENIYSPQVTIIKDSRDTEYQYIEPVKVSMIAIAALKDPKLVGDKLCQRDYNITFEKLDSIFKIGIINGHDSLVLGALGCGAYHNPPLEIAQIYNILIQKYGKYYKKIGFAILVVKPGDQENINVFKSIISVS